MTYFVLANRDIIKTRHHRSDFHLAQLTKKQKIIIAGFVGLALALAIIYVYTINGIIGATYELRKISKNAEEVSIQSKSLEIEAARRQAVSDLPALVSSLNLVAVEKIDYLTVGNAADPLALAGR